MPNKPRPGCAHINCPAKSAMGSRFCAKHGAAKPAQKSLRPRESSSARGYGYRWQKLRGMKLRRDPICETADCNAPATDVDHIKPKAEGGLDEFDNLQSLCKSCHSRKTATENEFGNQPKKKGPRVNIICGPPACGKSTYVRKHKAWGDVICDLDELMRAISGQEMFDHPPGLGLYTKKLREALHWQLENRGGVRVGWLIETAPTASRRALLAKRFGGTVYVFETSSQVCQGNVMKDERRRKHWQSWGGRISTWWKDYEKHEGDVIL